MSELIFTKTGVNMLSGNSIDFEVAISPYNATVQKQSIFVIISIAVEVAPGSAVFTEVKSQKVFANDLGVVSIDVGSIVHAYLDYFLPPANLDRLMEVVGQSKRFKVKFSLYDDLALLTDQTQIITAIKAGASYEYFNTDNSYPWMGSSTEQMLLFITDGKDLVSVTDVFFIFFCFSSGTAQNIFARYTINYLLDAAYGSITGDIAGIINKPAAGYTDLVYDVTWIVDAGVESMTFFWQLPTLPGIDSVKIEYRVLGTEYWDSATTSGTAGGVVFLSSFPDVYEVRFASYNGATLVNTTASVFVEITNSVPVLPNTVVFSPVMACLPSGFNQLNLQSYLPAGAVPISYEISFFSNDGLGGDDVEFLAPIQFKIDHRKSYGAVQLLYRNSLGGLQPLRMLGQIDTEGEYKYQLVNRIPPPSYLLDGNLIGDSDQQYSEENMKFKGETGFMPKYQVDRLRDFFLSKQRYEVKDGRLIPIILNAKNVKFFTNRDNLISVQVEWQHAFTNQYYSNTNLPPDACPAINQLHWRQNNDDEITVYWAFPFGHSYGRISIEFPGEPLQYYFLVGNSGLQKVGFIRPASAVDVDVNIVVVGNVICNRYNMVPSYGPNFTIPAALLLATLLPVANNDVYNIPAGYITGVSLVGSVLANDYAPSGATIEVIENSGATTAGGTFEIDSDGFIIYTPPSSIYTGADTFTYEIRKTPDGTPVTATVTINVGTVSTSIYAKIVGRNFNVSYTDVGEIWIDFFSNPAGTIPIDISAFGLTINYNKNVATYYDPTGADSADYPGSIAGTGFRVKIYDGLIIDYSLTYPIITVFTITPGTGYTGI
ncbi:MAG: Ig-like domain-containing protein [Bacteroidota bacterium]